jgi:DNA-binding CsgD family transcriptional regulator
MDSWLVRASPGGVKPRLVRASVAGPFAAPRGRWPPARRSGDGPPSIHAPRHVEAPTLDVSEGGGEAPRRVAGRDPTRAALVLEPDRLRRLLIVQAVASLGFVVAREVAAAAGGTSPAAVFLPLDGANDCGRAVAEARDLAVPGALVAGYGTGAALLLAAHRAHRCADLVLLLTATADGSPCLHYLPCGDPVAAAGLTAREADVLILLLHGLTTRAVASRLCVAESTARTHCRAVLRKLGTSDRAALRALATAGDHDWPRESPSHVSPVLWKAPKAPA